MLLNNNFTNSFIKIATSVVMASFLISCSGSEGAKGKKGRLEGERISVLIYEQALVQDDELKSIPVSIPAAIQNKNWSQTGGNLSKVLHHVSIGASPQKIWSRDVGEGSSGRRSLISAPVVKDGILYAIDSMSKVTALNAVTGKVIWKKEFTEKGESKAAAYGGGITVGGDQLFITNGYGHFISLERSTGNEIWRFKAGAPFRGAPTYSDGRVFALTMDNQTYALDSKDGSMLWNEVGISEVVGLVGAASPAVTGNTVISAYSSGELYAMIADNGRVLWTDTLKRQGRLTAMATLRDIDGSPAIYDGKVYAASHSGRMVSVDLRTGVRVWEQNIGSLHTPWVAGEFIYVVTPESEIVCLLRRDGRVRWVKQLERFQDEDHKEPVFWHGPVLAGDRLIVSSSNGYALSISPFTGEVLSGTEMPDNVEIPPIVADGIIYFFTRDAEVIAYK